MRLPMVYIAGPYSHPDPVLNTRTAIKAGMRVWDEGYGVPVIPHLTMLAHLVTPRPLEFWYEFDLALVARCDAVWRLPGESTGADNEVAFAEEHNIPVVTDIEELVLAPRNVSW